MTTSTLTWRTETMRVVAVCGDLDVGAIFPGPQKRCRWRAFITANMNPAEGTETNESLARDQVEKRWAAVLAKAKLQPIPKTCPRCSSSKVITDDDDLTCGDCNYVGPIENPNQNGRYGKP